MDSSLASITNSTPFSRPPSPSSSSPLPSQESTLPTTSMPAPSAPGPQAPSQAAARPTLPSSESSANQAAILINQTPELKKLVEKILLHGSPTPLKGFLETIVENLRQYALLQHKESKGQIPLWTSFATDLKFNIFSECCFFHHDGFLYILSPKSMEEITLQRVELKANLKRKAQHLEEQDDDEEASSDEEGASLPSEEELEVCGRKELVTMTGEIPSATIIFRKMPRYFTHQNKLFLGYPIPSGSFIFKTLDLTTFQMADFPCASALPDMDFSAANEGALDRETYYLVTSASTLWTLDLRTRVWTRRTLTGPGPTILSGSSNLWNGKLYTFSTLHSTVYELNLAELRWAIIHTISSPQLALRDCHLMRLHHNSFVLMRMSDNSELWVLDMETKIWEKRKTVGVRPGNYSTNPSYLLLNNAIYCLSGQSTDKHILSLTGPNPYPPSALPGAALNASQPAAAAAAAVAAAPGAPNPQTSAAPAFTPKPGRRTEIMRLVLKDPEAKAKPEQVERKRLRQEGVRVPRDEFTDISFLVAGRQISAHRCVLSASPVFKRMFLEEERGKSVITVGQTDPELFKAVVDSFYVPLDLQPFSNRAAELFVVAGTFGAEGLQRKILEEFNSLIGEDHSMIFKACGLTIGFNESDPLNQRFKSKVHKKLTKLLPKLTHTKEFEVFCQEHVEYVPLMIQAVSKIMENKKSKPPE